MSTSSMRMSATMQLCINYMQNITLVDFGNCSNVGSMCDLRPMITCCICNVLESMMCKQLSKLGSWKCSWDVPMTKGGRGVLTFFLCSSKHMGRSIQAVTSPSAFAAQVPSHHVYAGSRWPLYLPDHDVRTEFVDFVNKMQNLSGMSCCIVMHWTSSNRGFLTLISKVCPITCWHNVVEPLV